MSHVGRHRRWALVVLAMCAGCDEGPDADPEDGCAELAPDQLGVKPTGRLDATNQGRVGTSPGHIDVIVKNPEQTAITVQGCTRAANGDLWRLMAVWDSLPPADQLPADVGVYPKWKPVFSGELAYCVGGDCRNSFQSVFRVLNIGGFDEGSGVVNVLDIENGRFVATMTVFNGQQTSFPHEPTTIDADLTWSPDAVPH
jgi:hypothetical protein